MRISLHECKKAFTSPILIVLILLFSAFNIFLIFNNSYYKEELKVANELAETYGINITDKSLRRFKQDLQMDIVKLNEIVGRQTDKEFGSVYEFLDKLRYEDQDLYSEEDWNFFKHLQLKEMYFNLAESIDSEYDKMDWNRIGEFEIHKYRLSGSAAKMLKNEYNKLSQRFEILKGNAEHKTWFFAGKLYRMHGFLFASVFKSIIFESLMLIVLATALIVNFEFENKTYLVAYSTRRGRSLMKDKFVASLMTATGILTIILIITLGTYFLVFNYSHLWNSAISSGLNWEYNLNDLPYVSWWNLSFTTYLLCSILLLYVCMLLFSVIVFSISVFVKNSYFTFFLFAALFAIALLVPGFMPVSSNLIVITACNLSVLLMNPHLWFMGNGGLTMFKNYELVTVGSWTILTSAFCIFSLKTFKKQEIY